MNNCFARLYHTKYKKAQKGMRQHRHNFHAYLRVKMWGLAADFLLTGEYPREHAKTLARGGVVMVVVFSSKSVTLVVITRMYIQRMQLAEQIQVKGEGE